MGRMDLATEDSNLLGVTVGVMKIGVPGPEGYWLFFIDNPLSPVLRSLYCHDYGQACGRK